MFSFFLVLCLASLLSRTPHLPDAPLQEKEKKENFLSKKKEKEKKKDQKKKRKKKKKKNYEKKAEKKKEKEKEKKRVDY